MPLYQKPKASLGSIADIAEIADLAESMLTSIAIVFGGVWAYFKYFKGRTFHERLALSATGQVEQHDNGLLLSVATTVTNVGLSQVPVSQEGSGLDILICDPISPDAEMAEVLEWNSVATVPVLHSHEWIEPGETILD